jgi:hypothetical protein
MDYAMDMFIPIVGGLFLAQWLINQHQWPSITIVAFPVVGLFLGIGLLYKRQLTNQQAENPQPPPAHQPEPLETLSNDTPPNDNHP